MLEKPNVMLGVPAYGSMVHTDFVHTMFNIEQAKDANVLDYSLMTLGNESLITRARNTIISAFYHNKQFTHLFFIDADIGFNKYVLPNMLSESKDVIGCKVPLKGKDQNGNPVFNVGKVLKSLDNCNTVEVEHVGNAVLMLSRKACTSLCETSNTYEPSTLTRGEKSDKPQFDVFKVGVKNGVYLSEDYFLCHRLMELGYTINVLKESNITHNGNYSFEG
jgi:hypothetical protein